MEIIINGQQAFLKKNTSFEYISENSMFTGSDSYTLSITFPLKDCPQNQRIFGHINRQDVDKNKVLFDCDIRDRTFFKSGSITITQINEVEVKTQFLEGRSEQNFNDSFDDVYLNQMNLGYPDAEQRKPANVDVYTSWLNSYPYVNWVPLPWVNNYSGNLQNAVKRNNAGDFIWAYSNSLTFQPFLVYILEKICEVMGYAGNFDEIKNSRWQYLLICNTLPWSWGAWNFAIALPHWTLTEFFEQLELLMGGEFAINHKAKTITFRFLYKIADQTPPVHVEEVVNKYSVDVSRENSNEYIGTRNLAYADNDNRFWPYKSCQWYIDEHKKEAIVYETLYDLLQWAKTQKESGYEKYDRYDRNGRLVGYGEAYFRGYKAGSEANKLFYAKDVDCYFIMWCYKTELIKTDHIEHLDKTYNYYKYYYRLEPVNQFGKRVLEKDAEDVELSIVPAWIDDTDEDFGQCFFLDCGEMGSAVSWTSETDENGTTTGGTGFGGNSNGYGASYGEGTRPYEVDETDYNDGALAQTTAGKAIAKGEKEKNDAYFDCIYVAFWDGINRQNGKLPRPMVDIFELQDDFTAKYMPYSLRINSQTDYDDDGIQMKYSHDIDSKKKYNFSFLSDTIPDPRAVFYIEGGKYVCEKITATFHEDTGKSQLLKGVFYRIVE